METNDNSTLDNVCYIGGRLKNFHEFWQQLTNDKFILNAIQGAKISFISEPQQCRPVREIQCVESERLAINKEIETFVAKGFISETKPCPGQFVSQIFSRPKKSGGRRIILNLTDLNIGVEYEHFKMENLNTALSLMVKDCFMASIDLKDAYYSVAMHPYYKKFLRFYWNGRLFEFNCLPMGLASAPRLFTKILKPIFALLRSEGHVSAYYLDDSWLMGTSYEECKLNVERTTNVLSNAGFIINNSKSVFIPSQCIQFLGFCLNSVDMTVSLPTEKRNHILSMCTKICSLQSFTIRFLSTFIGTLVASLPGVQYGELHYRFLEFNRNTELRKAKGNFDAMATLDLEARTEVSWWLANIGSVKKNIIVKPPDITITTDASMLGWGAVFTGSTTGGHWNSEEAQLHINALELKAVLFGLQSFCNDFNDKHIRIRSDNTTAVAYINKLGGVKSIICHRIVTEIWNWAFRRKIHLSAEHLPGSQNLLADKASRVFDVNTEWMLSNEAFEAIDHRFGKFDIDLFASRLNAKTDIYASWKPDPNAVFIDAFSSSWNHLKFYAFPPFSLILNCLMKVEGDQASGVIVLPLWPTQAWYPKLMRMLVAVPLILPLNVLSLPFKIDSEHKQCNTLRLMACHISGNFSLTEDFRKTLSMSCVHPGDTVQSNSMKSILKSGVISAVKGRLIPCSWMKLKL